MNPSSTPPSSTPDAVLAGAAEGLEPPDALDALLRQIVGGYFVLTDGQGAVSKWSEPAELLFGRASEEILGQGFFETLVGGTLPPGGQAWRGFLDLGEPPQVPGTVELVGRSTDGTEFPLAAVFVPVKLDEGFDFSLFLEDLSFELPMNLMLLRMRQQHPVVVRALRQAIEPVVQPWEGWRTAGTLIVFTPLSSTPWVDEELARRAAEREAADSAAEERLTNPDPGVQGSVADLDDAAAVVARLLSALERIDELERVANGLPAQLEEARRDAEARAAQAERDAQALRSELTAPQNDVELLARIERLERARLDGDEVDAERRRAFAAAESVQAQLAGRLDQLERAAGDNDADARFAEALAAAEERAAEAIRRADAAFEAHSATADVASQLERIRAEHEEALQAAKHELTETIERLERDREREREAARAELAGALERVERVQREADAVREQLSAVTVERHTAEGLAGDDRRRLEELAREAEALRARVDSLREEGAQSAELAELRDVVERQGVAAAELRAAVDSRPDDSHELAELREAIERHESASRRATDELAELRAQIAAHERAVDRDVEETAVREEVKSLVGDAQTQVAALHARIEAMSSRVASAAELAALRERLDGFAGRDELTVLRQGLQAVAGRDEVHALRERIDAIHANDEIEVLKARIEALPNGDEALATAREALERVNEVDRGAGTVLTDVQGMRADLARVGGELEAARAQIAQAETEALGAREAAATASGAATSAREDAAKAREEGAALRRELENVALVGDDIARLDESSSAARSEAAEARAAAESLAERLTSVHERAAALSDELASGHARLDAVSTQVEQRDDALRTELSAVREVAETAQSGLEALRAELSGVREAADAVKADAAAARAAAERGNERVEAMQAEVAFAISNLDELKQGLSSAGQAAVIARREAEQARKAAQIVGDGSTERVTEVFQQILGLAAARNAGNRRPAAQPVKKADPVKREPRHGFDDVTTPMAILALDGKFKELNPAFTRLVGYQEHEFTKAAWPSPHDRRDYKDQLEQLRKLGLAELNAVEVSSTYMHGQGLMVPVVGKLSVELGEDGLPLQLVLEAEDRHTG
ncbi:MAG TPA: PAS domain-containing protein [Thermoanaerobaculia bacterium]|nr:PAS domain-containing protein [Thermoanaerobaculia bacterium]